MYERQGIAVMTPTVPGSPQGPFLGIPRGTMRRQKSIGKMLLLYSLLVHQSHPFSNFAPFLKRVSLTPLPQ